jgi:CDP-diacylglycerol--glycerol-3-phosphate 3-phosphatidyltransferase
VNLPNALTLLRIFFVPLLVAALVQESWSIQIDHLHITNEWLALAVFLAAALTDLLDGYLARRWKQITTVGTLLDPIADKLLVSSALIALVQVRIIPAWMAILVVGREFAVSGLRGIAAAEGYVIRASDFGKIKLITQVVAISLAVSSIRNPTLRPWMLGWMWGVVAVSLLSAALYFRKFWRKVDVEVKQRRRRELLQMERAERADSDAEKGMEPIGGQRT